MLHSSRLLIVPVIAVLLLGALSGVSCSRIKIKASISGTVYMDGRPTSGTVLLSNKDGGTVAMERTNTSGHFRITDVDPGTYTLQYLNLQGVPWGHSETIVVRLGRPEIVDLQLSMEDRQLF